MDHPTLDQLVERFGADRIAKEATRGLMFTAQARVRQQMMNRGDATREERNEAARAATNRFLETLEMPPKPDINW